MKGELSLSGIEVESGDFGYGSENPFRTVPHLQSALDVLSGALTLASPSPI